MNRISRDKARSIRPALRKLVGQTLYTEGLFREAGLALGLTKRQYQGWRPELVQEFLSSVCFYAEIQLTPVVSCLAEAFVVEAKSTSLNSTVTGLSETKTLAMRQFLSFRAHQLNQVYEMGKAFWTSECDDPMFWKMIDAEAPNLTDRLQKRVKQCSTRVDAGGLHGGLVVASQVPLAHA